MKERELPKDLLNLIAKISELPDITRATLASEMDKLIEFTMRRQQVLSLVQDALGQLRLDMKYLMFDLEATRRERDAAIAKED